MNKSASFCAVLVVGALLLLGAGISGCKKGNNVEGTQWEADMSTLQWGQAGNSIVSEGDSFYITLSGGGSYIEQWRLGGEDRDNVEGTWEVESEEGETTVIKVNEEMGLEIAITITGDTLTYTRSGVDIGTITATLNRYER